MGTLETSFLQQLIFPKRLLGFLNKVAQRCNIEALQNKCERF